MKIAIFATLLLGQIAFAQVQLNAVSEDHYTTTLFGGTRISLITGAYDNFFVQLPAPRMADVQKILMKMNQMNQDYGLALAIPENLDLKIWSVVGGEREEATSFTATPAASFDYTYNLMITGTQLGGPFGQPVEKFLPVSVHEYGHVLFLSAMEKASSKFAAFLADLRASRRTIDKFNDWYGYIYVCTDGQLTNPDLLLQFLNGPNARETGEKICAEMVPLQKKAQVLANRAPTANSNIFEMLKYLELFADTVAVVDADDLEVMAALPGVGKSRSFANCPDSVALDDMDPHNYFSPARCQIGKLYLLSKTSGIAKAEFLRKVFKVISSILMGSLSQYSDEYVLSPLGKKADQNLLRELNREFANSLQLR